MLLKWKLIFLLSNTTREYRFGVVLVKLNLIRHFNKSNILYMQPYMGGKKNTHKLWQSADTSSTLYDNESHIMRKPASGVVGPCRTRTAMLSLGRQQVF